MHALTPCANAGVNSTQHLCCYLLAETVEDLCEDYKVAKVRAPAPLPRAAQSGSPRAARVRLRAKRGARGERNVTPDNGERVK
jgi:hypothetical protein